MKHTKLAITTLFTITALAPVALAGDPKEEEHFDAWFRNVDGKVVTGSRNEDLSFRSFNERVFGAEFGEDPMFPFFAAEPGFQTVAGEWDPFTTFNFNVTDTIRVWNGSGFDNADETMTIGFEGSSITTGAGPMSGFAFGTDGDGVIHDHFDFTLNGGGSPFGPTDPDNGIYLLSLSVGLDGDASSFSDTFWFVMNLNMDEEDHEASIDWVQNNLVPAPGAGLMAGLLLIGQFRGRRRRTA